MHYQVLRINLLKQLQNWLVPPRAILFLFTWPSSSTIRSIILHNKWYVFILTPKFQQPLHFSLSSTIFDPSSTPAFLFFILTLPFNKRPILVLELTLILLDLVLVPAATLLHKHMCQLGATDFGAMMVVSSFFKAIVYFRDELVAALLLPGASPQAATIYSDAWVVLRETWPRAA